MASSATDAGHSEKLIRKQLIESGAVDCIVSVANNFFYTRSLPCHLWFFDKGKMSEPGFTGLKDGEDRRQSKDTILMLDARNVFRKVTTTINDFSEEQLQGLTAIMKMYRGEKHGAAKNNEWFNDHFPDGKYRDVEGLCKIVTLDEVEENDWSLTPGRYVGVTLQEDDGFDYATRLLEIQEELNVLNEESVRLSKTIAKNLKELV